MGWAGRNARRSRSEESRRQQNGEDFVTQAKVTPNIGSDLNAGVPGIATFCVCASDTFAEAFERVCDREAGYKFHALVAELARHPQAEWTTEAHRKISVVHRIRHQSLRMESVSHVDALPPVGLDGEVNDVARLRQNPGGIENFV